MKNKEYWKQRQERLQERLMKKGEDFYRELAKEYEKAAVNIQKEIEAFYGRFAKNNKIDYAESKKILTSSERKAYQMTLDEYIEKGRTLNYSDEWANRLENASTVHRTSRLQSLQMQMRQQAEEISAKYAEGMTKVAKEIYEDGYYRQIYEIQAGTGTGKGFSVLDTKRIDYIVSKSWTKDKTTFSDRIWTDKTKLIDWLNVKVSQNFIRGDSPTKLISEMTKEFKTKSSNAARLILTESAFFSSRATYDGYGESGVEKFEFLATLDEKTCPICGSMDGKSFDLKDYQVGLNADPLHAYCRCTTIPYFDDTQEYGKGKRATRDEIGKTTYKVDGNITYGEWKEKYVNNTLNRKVEKK